MAFRIEESFRVEAPPDRVWAFLTDPERVVECLPGAELLERVDEATFRGRIRVSVGPVNTAYDGSATFAEVDPEARRVRVEARGEEARGPGSASMTMESVVAATEDGSEVRVTADVEVAGKIVQFGRGMIQTVSTQLFRKFTECCRSTLEGSGASGSDADETGAATTDPTPEARASGDASGADADGSGGGGSGPGAGPRGKEDSLNVVELVLSALREKIRSLFGRRS